MTVKFSLWPVGCDTCCINNNNLLFMVRFILKTLLNNHSVTPSTVPAVKSWQNPLPESLGSITTCRRLPPVSGGETAAVILLSHQYWCHLSRQQTLCVSRSFFFFTHLSLIQRCPKWFKSDFFYCYMLKSFSFPAALKGQRSRLIHWVFTDLVTCVVLCVDKWIKIQGPGNGKVF